MNPKDTYNSRIVSEPFTTKDSVVFSLNWSENDEYRSCIYSFDGDKTQELTTGGSEKTPCLIGKDLYYIHYDGNCETLKRQSEKYTESLCTFKKILKYMVTGSKIVALVETEFEGSNTFVTTRIKYASDGRGLLQSKRKLVEISPSGISTLVEGDFDVLDFCLTKGRIIFTSSEENDDIGLALQDVYAYDRKGGAISRITEGKGSALLVSADEEGNVAYVGHRAGITLSTPHKLIFPLKGKEVEIGRDINLLFTDMFPSGQNRLLWNDGFYTIGVVEGESYLFKYKTKARRVTVTGKSVLDFHVSSRSIAYVYSTFSKPSILVFNGKEYDPNPDFEGTVAKRGKAENVEYWAMISDINNPTVLFVHGGPHDAYGNVYFCEHDFMAKNGFNVIFSNPTGSCCYGKKFAEGCLGDWGGKPFSDLMKVIDQARSEYGLRENFHITGLSYGGFLTIFATIQTNRFLSAVSEAPVTNFFTMVGTSDIGFWYLPIESNIEDPWSSDSILKMTQISPICGAKRILTPTMFIHGEDDFRCPIEQSEQMYRAMRMNNVESVFVRFKGESHLLSIEGKPSTKENRLRLKLEWFKTHLKN